MKKNYLVYIIYLVSVSGAYAAKNPNTSNNTQQLDTIYVTDKKLNNPFKSPKAVNHRDVDILGRDNNEILREIPGVFTQHDIGQGGIAINLRGLEGAGRVNTTIDGVTQTFYQDNPAHGWNGNSTYIDENLIAATDISKGATYGISGLGTLGGAAEFRTIDVDDIIGKDKNIGLQVNFRHGINGYGNNGMIATAIKQSLGDNGGNISFLSAFTSKRKYGYRNGAGELIAGDKYDSNVSQESGVIARYNLNKFHFSPNKYHKITLSHLYSKTSFMNNHTPIMVKMDTKLAKYHYKPLSDLIDLKADISYNIAKQTFKTGESAYENYIGRTTENPSLAFSIQNNMLFDIHGNDLNLTYGGKIQKTSYDSNYTENKALLVEGKQGLKALFIETKLEFDKWQFATGLNLEHYNMQGYLPPTEDDGAIILPRGGNWHFNRKETHLNPRVTLSYKPIDWLQVYTNFGKNSRSPNVQEFMYVNNVRGLPYAINPYLKGESSFNRDIGFNIFKENLFVNDDTLRLKVNYFNNRIKNYITQDQFYICGNNNLKSCTINELVDDSDAKIGAVGIYRNQPDTTRMRGWEIEGGYDIGKGFINISYSKTTTTFPNDYLSDMGFSHLRILPEKWWILDLGTRLLNNKLTIGGKIRYMGKDTVATGVDVDTQKQETRLEANNPKIIDIYATFKTGQNLTLFFNIENLTNRTYNYPVSGGTLGTGNLGDDNNVNQGTGRGRTIYGGFSLKF